MFCQGKVLGLEFGMRSIILSRGGGGAVAFSNFNTSFGGQRPASTNAVLLRVRALQSSRNLLLLLLRNYKCSVIRSSSNSNSNSISKTTEQNKKMAIRTEKQHQNPNASKIQQVIHSNSSDGWEKCWDQGLTPWDLGQPTPVMVHLHQTSALPKGRALVPGCGSGHDVVAIACPERYVVGLDISDKAIKKAVELSSSLPNADYFTFLKTDFFTWRPTELFDLIFDYTFFCAIEPDMRSAWASQMRDLLKPDGELITLMFPISDHVGGPPYKVSVADYEEVLHPMGLKAVSIVENELAIGPRKGREKFGRWKKFIINQSLL